MRGRLKVVFLPDFSVKLGHRVYPGGRPVGTDLACRQGSSGTGNMKFAMNGALTIGTLDGANIEIREEVGAENFFLFGLTAAEVEQRSREGYNPRALYESNPICVKIFDSLGQRRVFPRRSGPLRTARPVPARPRRVHAARRLPVLHRLPGPGERSLQDQEAWTRMSILNVARIGKFSSDRAIRDYCSDIWKTWPVKIQL